MQKKKYIHKTIPVHSARKHSPTKSVRVHKDKNGRLYITISGSKLLLPTNVTQTQIKSLTQHGLLKKVVETIKPKKMKRRRVKITRTAKYEAKLEKKQQAQLKKQQAKLKKKKKRPTPADYLRKATRKIEDKVRMEAFIKKVVGKKERKEEQKIERPNANLPALEAPYQQNQQQMNRALMGAVYNLYRQRQEQPVNEPVINEDVQPKEGKVTRTGRFQEVKKSQNQWKQEYQSKYITGKSSYMRGEKTERDKIIKQNISEKEKSTKLARLASKYHKQRMPLIPTAREVKVPEADDDEFLNAQQRHEAVKKLLRDVDAKKKQYDEKYMSRSMFPPFPHSAIEQQDFNIPKEWRNEKKSEYALERINQSALKRQDEQSRKTMQEEWPEFGRPQKTPRPQKQRSGEDEFNSMFDDKNTTQTKDETPKEEKTRDNDDDQTAQGKSTDKGLSETQINKAMKTKTNKGWMGTVASDEILTNILPKVRKNKPIAFVMNTDPRTKPGNHWVSIYISPKDASVEFYDSFGREPSPKVKLALKKIMDKLNLKTMYKFKINRVKQQTDNSNTCGYHSMKFLLDRFKGKTFPQASGFDDRIQDKSKKYEKEINNLKKQKAFGYI